MVSKEILTKLLITEKINTVNCNIQIEAKHYHQN